MPICHPEHPHFNNSEGERKVWQALKDQLPDGAYLLHGYQITDDKGDHEADSIVVWPGVGIVFIETKGGRISINQNGEWTTTNSRGKTSVIRPARQAKETMYAFEQYVEKHWSQGSLRMIWLVAFPDSELTGDVHTRELPRNRMIDNLELEDIADVIKREARAQGLQAHASRETCEAFIAAIEDRRDPSVLMIEDSIERQLAVRDLTENQAEILDYLSLQKSFLVLGPAGSGKTFLALKQAQRLCAAGKRVALVCYSQGLSQYLKRETDTWPVGHRPAFVGTFHGLAYFWSLKSESEKSDEWWKIGYAQELIDFLLEDRRADRFDSIVVDEGQDFDELWWTALNLAYRQDLDHSELYVFGDDDQALAPRTGLLELPLSPVSLKKNLRSTKQVAETAGLLASEMPANSGIEGPSIVFVECAPEDAHDVASDMVEIVQDWGWLESQIAVITTNHRHAGQHEAIERLGGTREYWSSFWGDDVFYAHTTGFKGLERPVVIVAVDGWKEPDRARQTLYAATSRPRDLLVVCGDLQMIKDAGGRELAEKLAAHQL